MTGILKMDLRRLFKTRSFYLSMLWAMVILAIFATAGWFFADEALRSMGGTQVMGMPADRLIHEARKMFNVSRFASFFMGAPSLMHLLLVTFGAGFLAKDHQTGYFKNLLSIRGLRTKWLLSKVVTLLVAGTVFYLALVLGSVLATALFGNTPRVDLGQLTVYFGLHLISDMALFMVIAAVVAFFQSRTAAVMMAMVLSFNMQAILYLLIDQIGFLPFKLARSGLMSMTGRLDISAFGQGEVDLLSGFLRGPHGPAGTPAQPITLGELLPVSLGIFAVMLLVSWLILRYRDYKG